MITAGRADEIMGRYSEQKVLVIGDLILDKYVTGTVNRISPEAPVPVVYVNGEYSRPGGAANVAVNIQTLGGGAVVSGVVGNDPDAKELEGLIGDLGISTVGMLSNDALDTTVKTRIVADRQQVVRVDREHGSAIDDSVIKDFCTQISGLSKDATGIIIEDYGKGAITQEVVNVVLDSADKAGIPVAFDPKANHDMDISGIALATPNYREACLAAGLRDVPLSDDPVSDPNLMETSEILMSNWNTDLLIITLGSHGMCLLRRGEDPHIIPTRAREVFDVSGAGDTVIATAFLSMLSGANYEESAALANFAAGVVVAKLGTAICTRDELMDAIRQQ